MKTQLVIGVQGLIITCIRTYPAAKCCDGWDGSISNGCNKAKCNGLTDPGACSRIEGNVKVSASGPIYTSSGGTCYEPNKCRDCNPGYFVDGSYCRACPEIDNCHYPSCTNPANSVCKYCKGVVKDDPTQYGWWAYTRWVDHGVSCRLACSWRQGSRCYPGSCDDTTVASCKCADGFEGTDCATINDLPSILGNFAQFKHTTETSEELVEVPADSSAPSPQDIVYTNNIHIDTSEAYIDAQYVKSLPATPDNFYIKHEDSLVGIVDGGVSLQLVRDTSSPDPYTVSCPADTPIANNYRCEGTFNLKDKWSAYYPLKHGDSIVFTAFATNGGHVTVFDRENNDNEVTYDLQGKTNTHTFEIEIDTEKPKHCRLTSSTCDDKPLDVVDVAVVNSITVRWKGWYDPSSGIDSYRFEVFRLQSSGPGQSSELKQGDKVTNAISETLPSNTAETTLTLSTPGPYAVTIAAFDKAGNHRSARSLLIFDDKSQVSKQGTRRVSEGNDGSCTWKETPAAPIISNASPLVNCDWVVHFGPINIVWKDYFINIAHHNGQWLNAVSQIENVESSLDDHEGQRQLQRVENVLGIVAFEVSYEIIFEGETTTVTWQNVSNIESQSSIITPDLQDGMGLNITVRAVDFMGAYADEHVFVKVDSSPPIINNLWLTRGNMTNISVHSSEELSEMTIEWEGQDVDSGIETATWRLFDNYTGEDFLHGMAFVSAQGNMQTLQECRQQYAAHAGGDGCYCTPFDGCFHRHFQVKPRIDNNGTDGLASDKHIGSHDYDYYIEVTMTNLAGLKMSVSKKISIDVSPPVPGIVHEGLSGAPEIDFQQDHEVHVHWKGFFDKESGIMFYEYLYGESCFDEDMFTIEDEDTDQPIRTYLDFASFTVPTDGTYYVTVVAYNRALEPSVPVCSDGVTIDSSIPTVFHVKVAGTTTDPGPIKTDDNTIWYLHEDRTLQQVEQPMDSCRDNAYYLSASELSLYRVTTDSQGSQLNISTLDCANDIPRTDILSYTTSVDKLEVSWKTDSSVHLYNTEIGLASAGSMVPDVTDFESVYYHTSIRLENLNLVDGQMFDILIKTTSKSGIFNLQKVGPFITARSPPSFHGEITLSERPDSSILVASWDEDAFIDNNNMGPMKLEYAIGNQPRGVEVHGYQDLHFDESCLSKENPTCTVINMEAAGWSLHHLHDYYVTIKATNKVGLSVTAVSSRYTPNHLKPTAGVVLDVSQNSLAYLRQDEEFQSSITQLQGEWFGFGTPRHMIDYTVCQAIDGVIIESTCKNVGQNSSGTLTGLSMDYFTVYQLAVIASSPGGNITSFSDGIMPVDTALQLDDIELLDGPACEKDSDISMDNYGHQNQVFVGSCSEDLDYQISQSVLSTHWDIPGSYKPFITDIYWKIQERAPFAAEHWEDTSEERHLISSLNSLSTKLSLTSGRAYRYSVKFCASELCFPSLHSDGVTVIHYPPVTGTIAVEYEHTNIGTKLKVTMDKFKDPDIEDLEEAQSAIDHYDWAITENDNFGHILNQWTTVTDTLTVTGGKMYFEVQLSDSIHFHTCWRFNVRGYNKVGSYSTVSKDIHDCLDESIVREPKVIDCVGPTLLSEDGTEYGGDIYYEQNTYWTDRDRDYSPHGNVISAVWPRLRYPRYSYVVLEIPNSGSALFHKQRMTLDISQSCDDSSSIGCGVTEQNFANIHAELAQGKRYTVCLHANTTTLVHEEWDEELPELNVCSDGITIDLTSPIPGKIYINGPDVTYQQSVSEMHVIWESFIDVEELSNAEHSTGIASYEVGIGKHRGDSDVQDFVNVNVTNHVIFHDLNLQNGHKYYATVKGYDFTGKYSTAYSSAVTIDNTSPKLSNASITMGARHISDRNGLNIRWPGLFSDAESGIHYYKYAIGSRAGFDDIYPFTETTQEQSNIVAINMKEFHEGHIYTITVEGYNGAGLSTTASSWAFVVDYSPPIPGHVFDGVKETGKDIDYQTEKHTLEAYWAGFYDPHTSIQEYYIEVGSEKGIGDVLQRFAVGTKEDIVLDGLILHEGYKYFITITACNTANLCSNESTDGILIDSSPPTIGIVKDGAEIDDIEYQSSGNYVLCKWFNFVDAQSGISKYTWRLGTSAGDSDIIEETEVHTGSEIILPDLQSVTGQTLPVGQRLFSTVRAYNKAGLWSEATSNGFTVDSSPPSFVTELTQSSLGSLKESTTVLKDILKVTWDVRDTESSIDRQYLSIVSHIGEDFNVSIQIPGHLREYTFIGLKLHDGSLYDIIIWSCNGAKLCSKSSLTDLLADCSNPIQGHFAIHTDHASNLDRQQEWMTWSQDSLGLSLVGFSDEHSGISTYHVNVGSTYMASDLNKDDTVQVSHDDDTPYFSDDGGKVQTFTIATRNLSSYQEVFVAVWAENGVGLTSGVVHSQFKLILGGYMELIRRCSAYSCEGHCVCETFHKKCPVDQNAAPCIDVSSDPAYAEINVTVLLDPRKEVNVHLNIPTNTMLAAKWDVLSSGKIQPAWYEWSAGLTEESEPHGIFDSGERIWHDAAPSSSIYFTIKPEEPLLETEKYSVYIRAWYDGVHFAVFKSPGVVVQSTRPQVTSLFRKTVKEVLGTSSGDIDFVKEETEEFFIDWTGVFKDTPESLSRYKVFLSRVPGGHGLSIAEDLSTLTTRVKITLAEFNLNPGVRYYSNVQAYTLSGLDETVASDGFVIDNDKPTTGVVLDGRNQLDMKYQNQSDSISAHWYGFTDKQSSIVSYTWCVSSEDAQDSCDIVPQTNLGMRRSITYPIDSVENGKMVINEVFATDAAGHISETVFSNGLIIDQTAPVKVSLAEIGDNLVQNPSFEEDDGVHLLTEFRPQRMCSVHEISSWVPSECAAVVTGKVREGRNALWLRGNISQIVQTVSHGKSYSLVFYASHVPSEGHITSTEEVFVQFGNDLHVFKIHSRPGHSTSEMAISWQRVTGLFEVTSASPAITIGTLARSDGILIDDIVLTEMSEVMEDDVKYITAHAVLLHYFSSLHASWKCADPESGIKDYMWAIGTVRGGIQLQNFKSVGRRQFDVNSNLNLPHQTTLYITVVATNGADLKTVIYSDPLLIDKTPPYISAVNDGNIEGTDVEIQSSREIAFNFEVEDSESGVQECSWALGTKNEYISVFSYTKLSGNTRSGTAELPANVDTSRTLYVTVECVNGVGLVAEKRSNGVKVLLGSPDTSGVNLDILGQSDNRFPAKHSFQSRTDEVRLRWSGFLPTDNIDFYKVDIVGGNFYTSYTVVDSGSASTLLALGNLTLVQGQYSCLLRGINAAGIESDVITKNFTILRDSPSLTDASDVSIDWNQDLERATVDWDGVFAFPQELYYEVSMGTVEYGADIIMWQETVSTSITFPLSKMFVGEFGRDIYVVLTAVSPSGTFTTVSTSKLIVQNSEF